MNLAIILVVYAVFLMVALFMLTLFNTQSQAIIIITTQALLSILGMLVFLKFN